MKYTSDVAVFQTIDRIKIALKRDKIRKKLRQQNYHTHTNIRTRIFFVGVIIFNDYDECKHDYGVARDSTIS